MSAGDLLQGVWVHPVREIADARGAVLHVLRADAPEFTRFGECYCSEVLPAAIKGWKRHRLQTQNLAVPVGRIRFVLYDDRSESRTRGRTLRLELGRPDAYRRLTIPPGVWYGFACVGSTAGLIVNCTDVPHDPTEADTRPLDAEWSTDLLGLLRP